MSRQDFIPKYRKHKASGQAIMTLHGRDHYLGPYGSVASRAEYDRIVGEWLARGRTPAAREQEYGLTVVELTACYWAHAQTDYVKNGEPTSEQCSSKSAYAIQQRLVCGKNSVSKQPELSWAIDLPRSPRSTPNWTTSRPPKSCDGIGGDNTQCSIARGTWNSHGPTSVLTNQRASRPSVQPSAFMSAVVNQTVVGAKKVPRALGPERQ